MSAPVISDQTSILHAELTKAFTFQPSATNAPTLWEATGLPTGLSINASTGKITGTPTEAGIFQVEIRASNYDSLTWTADIGTDDLDFTVAHPFANNDIVQVSSTGTLPSPLAASTDYYVINSDTLLIELASTLGGAKIDITTTGTGVHSVSRKNTGSLTVLIPVSQGEGIISAADMAIEVDFDLLTGQVSIPGMPEGFPFGPPDGSELGEGILKPIISLKKGDAFPVLIGIKRNGVLQDLTLTHLQWSGKEFEPDSLYAFTTGEFTKEGSGTTTRFRTTLTMDADTFAALLSSYEEDGGTYVDALSEITIENLTSNNVVDAENTEALGTLDGDEDIDDTHVFTSLPQISYTPVQYTAVASLLIPTRPSQELTRTITFDLQWNGASFDVSNVSQTLPYSTSGPDAGDDWEATLSLEAVTGTASGVNIGTNVLTNTPASATTLQLPLFNLKVNGTSDGLIPVSGYGSITDDIEVYSSGPTLLGTMTLNNGDGAGGVTGAWDAVDPSISGDILSIDWGAPDADFITVTLDPGTVVIHVINTGDVDQRNVTVGSLGSSHSASVKVELDADGPDDTERRTSQTFKVRIERDMIPEA